MTRRKSIGKVVDFGAGDGRFANGGAYKRYVGYEIDLRRLGATRLPASARIKHGCAFSSRVSDADLVIGNPPFVRNQDLPEHWRNDVASRLEARSGIHLSGLANAWQYFFVLSLMSTKPDGLCALVIPFEWVSRPSVAPLRSYIEAQGWDVDVYRLADASFASVMTTASITIVDKHRSQGRWRFFETNGAGKDRSMPTAAGGALGHLLYRRRLEVAKQSARAIRGLSPGTQKVFVLTDGERARLGLKPGRDVVRCITSMRGLPSGLDDLDDEAFDRHLRQSGRRCWLLNPKKARLAGPLKGYIDTVDPLAYATRTCTERETWWDFVMPETPTALVATCFKGVAPKAILNGAGVKAVGGVAGIHGCDRDWAEAFLGHLSRLDLRQRIVSHANALMKIEIGQINTLIGDFEFALAR